MGVVATRVGASGHGFQVVLFQRLPDGSFRFRGPGLLDGFLFLQNCQDGIFRYAGSGLCGNICIQFSSFLRAGGFFQSLQQFFRLRILDKRCQEIFHFAHDGFLSVRF